MFLRRGRRRRRQFLAILLLVVLLVIGLGLRSCSRARLLRGAAASVPACGMAAAADRFACAIPGILL